MEVEINIRLATFFIFLQKLKFIPLQVWSNTYIKKSNSLKNRRSMDDIIASLVPLQGLILDPE